MRQTMGGSKIQTDGKARAEPKIGNGSHVLGRTWIPAKDEKLKSRKARVTEKESSWQGCSTGKRCMQSLSHITAPWSQGTLASVPCSCDPMSQG